MVFLGDYVDRGPDSRQVVERVRALASTCPARYVHLQGNHESAWLERYPEANVAFLESIGVRLGIHELSEAVREETRGVA